MIRLIINHCHYPSGRIRRKFLLDNDGRVVSITRRQHELLVAISKETDLVEKAKLYAEAKASVGAT